MEIMKLLDKIDPEQIQTLQEFIDNWDNIIEQDIQPLIETAKEEVLGELHTKVEEAQGEHQALWDAMQFMIFDEEVGD
jgi:flagellar biosynthesis chaperone FliJ